MLRELTGTGPAKNIHACAPLADREISSATEVYRLAVPIDGLALEAKKLSSRSVPIFSEKTLCSTLAQADDLIASCGEGQIFLMHKWEYHPCCFWSGGRKCNI
ncbi:MAG: hypothetical protein K9K36_02295 [Desulfarculaceae bacterium]|nr:hypothetical protein [Desulfarculaceae bacterium]